MHIIYWSWNGKTDAKGTDVKFFFM